MDARQKRDLCQMVGRVELDASMKAHTTFRIGGDAEVLCHVADLETLCRVLSYLSREDIPWLVVGRGSNLLVRDGGIRGVVLMLSGGLAQIDFRPDGLAMRAGGGLSIADILTACRRKGLSGLEFLAGIPGSVGGAVAMNAGAFENEIESRVQKVCLVDPKGAVQWIPRSELRFSYRSLHLEKRAVVAQIDFSLKPDTGKGVAERIAGYLKKRNRVQPLEYRSAGSVFRNPAHDYAGRLIEKAGLKGKRRGGAMISDRHANFIVNTGGADAADVLALIETARQAVMKTAGIWLELEIHVVGEPGIRAWKANEIR